MTTPGDCCCVLGESPWCPVHHPELAGATDDEKIAAKVMWAVREADDETWAEVERQFLGDVSDWKPTGLVQATTERCTCTDAGGIVEVRGGRCTYCRKPYVG